MVISALALKQAARALGFSRVGVTQARPVPRLAAYHDWLRRDYHGTLAYLARPDRQARRADLNLILPGAQSLILVGLNYALTGIPETVLADPARGRIAAYAWGEDYHAIFAERLETLAERLRGAAYKSYADTGAILEREHAQLAGLGFIGKNTLVIDRRGGSSWVLGEILTTAEMDAYDPPEQPTRCGSCTRCLTACPTQAFPEPYVLDARRCLSYLTIEHKGWIDHRLRAQTGNWVFGCDLCQTACPWNRFAGEAEPVLLPRHLDRAAPRLTTLLSLDEPGFQALFQGSPVARTGRVRLLRNACLAAGNSTDMNCLEPLEALLTDPAPLLRGHAAWAWARRQGTRSRSRLEACLRAETDPEARLDVQTTLASLMGD